MTKDSHEDSYGVLTMEIKPSAFYGLSGWYECPIKLSYKRVAFGGFFSLLNSEICDGKIIDPIGIGHIGGKMTPQKLDFEIEHTLSIFPKMKVLKFEFSFQNVDGIWLGEYKMHKNKPQRKLPKVSKPMLFSEKACGKAKCLTNLIETDETDIWKALGLGELIYSEFRDYVNKP